MRDGRYVIFANFIVAKNDNDRQYTPLYTAIFQENANRFYFKDDSTLVNVGIAYNYECFNSWDGILGMIPCICVFEKNGNNITNISNNEVLNLNMQINKYPIDTYEVYELREDSFVSSISIKFITNHTRILREVNGTWMAVAYYYNDKEKMLNIISQLNTLRSELEDYLLYKSYEELYYDDNNYSEWKRLDSYFKDLRDEEPEKYEDIKYNYTKVIESKGSTYNELYNKLESIYNNTAGLGMTKLKDYYNANFQISESEVLVYDKVGYVKVNWENEGTIYKTFPQGRGETIKDRTGFMYATKLNFGQNLQGSILSSSAFNFNKYSSNLSEMKSAIRLNDYKEIKKDNIDDIFYINNIGVQLPIIKILEYANIGWSGEDTAFICLAQIGVYPMT